MKKRDKKRVRREKMIWRGGNQFGLKNNALLELDGDCGPDCSAPLSHLGVWSVVVVMVCLTTREKISAHTERDSGPVETYGTGERGNASLVRFRRPIRFLVLAHRAPCDHYNWDASLAFSLPRVVRSAELLPWSRACVIVNDLQLLRNSRGERG